MVVSDCRVGLGLLFTAPPTLLYVALCLLLNVHLESPAQQKYSVAGATCLLRLWSGCSHADCLYDAITLLRWESQGESCGGFLPASKTSSTERAGGEVPVQFSPWFPLWYFSGFCHLRVSPAFLWCLPKGRQALTMKFPAFLLGDSALPRFTGISVYPGCCQSTACGECSSSLPIGTVTSSIAN